MIGIVAQNELIAIFGFLELARLLQRQPALQDLHNFLASLSTGPQKLLKFENLGARFHDASDSPPLRNPRRKRLRGKQKAGRGCLPAALRVAGALEADSYACNDIVGAVINLEFV